MSEQIDHKNANLTAAREIIALREKLSDAPGGTVVAMDAWADFVTYAEEHAAGIAQALIDAEKENSLYRKRHLECCEALSEFQCGGKYADFGTIGDHIWNTVPKVIAALEYQLEAERAKVERMRRAWQAYEKITVSVTWTDEWKEMEASHAEGGPTAGVPEVQATFGGGG